MNDKKKKCWKIFFLLAGAFGVLDTLAVSSVSNMNLGVVMPGIIGLPLLVLGLFYAPLTDWMHNSKLGALLKWMMIGVYALFFACFFAALFAMVRAGYQAPAEDADVVIVLGGGLRRDLVPRTLAGRLDKAAEYVADKPECVIVVSGGKGAGEAQSEASAMRDYLVAKGIDAGRILMEDQSTSTYENFALSMALIEKNLGEDVSVAFITTHFHVLRAELIARKQGFDRISGIGADGVWYIAINNYLREFAAITNYTFTGKI